MLSSGGRNNKSAAPVGKEKLHEELQDLPTQREKVIEERKQCDLQLKGVKWSCSEEGMLYYALEIREYHNDSMFSKLFLASDMKVGEKN